MTATLFKATCVCGASLQLNDTWNAPEREIRDVWVSQHHQCKPPNPQLSQQDIERLTEHLLTEFAERIELAPTKGTIKFS